MTVTPDQKNPRETIAMARNYHDEECRREVELVLSKLFGLCREADYSGYDPYDALNSRVIQAIPLLDFRLGRLAVTQALKRSPINVRHLLGVPRVQNPKGLGLFIAAYLKRTGMSLAGERDEIEYLTQQLVELRSSGHDYWCWGYSFPWQTRTIIVPSGYPNLVCTVFAANALLDAYDQRSDERYLTMALSAANYVLERLYWTRGSTEAGFAYPLPTVRVHIHNANFLGAALLSRAFKITGERRFLDPALKAARYSVSKQRTDGSWGYGDSTKQGWMDNFHTGFNLCALRAIAAHVPTCEFDKALRLGFDFYRTHFFRSDGAPRYFHDQTYPIDSHSAAQSIITLLELRDLHEESRELAKAVFRWSVNNMWDSKGFFYYRVLRFCTIRTPYMRWTQAWMALALATLLEELQGGAAEA